MDEHGRTIYEGLGEEVNEHGRTWTNMEERYLRGYGERCDEHGRTWTNVSKGGGGGVTNVDERDRTWTNLVEHCKTFGLNIMHMKSNLCN